MLRNQFLEAWLNKNGEVMSLKLLGDPKEFVKPGHLANAFVMFDDIPLYWDAWDVMDYHLETRKPAMQQASFVTMFLLFSPFDKSNISFNLWCTLHVYSLAISAITQIPCNYVFRD